MNYFADTVIKPYVIESKYQRVCEIGAKHGEMTDKLLEVDAVVMSIIDPCLDADLSEKYRGNRRVQVHKGISLEVLPKMSEPFDCILIDGDHNWYTVYHELKTIEQRGLLKPGGTIFFHDVGWPYGRRDLYYQPELIPEEFLHPYAQKGIVQGESELSDTGGANAEACNAVHEGGARNGVLTAIEDFLQEHTGAYKFFHFTDEFGLGVLLKTDNAVGSLTFNKYLLKAKQHALVDSLKGAARRKFPALYSSVKELKNKKLRKS